MAPFGCPAAGFQENIIMEQPTLTFRFAQKQDAALILDFIRALAQYEHLESEVTATEALLTEWIFEKKKAEVLFAVLDGREIGFALFFIIFPRFWAGRGSIWRIFTSCANTAVRVGAGVCSKSSRKSPVSAAAVAWSGSVLTGTKAALSFICRWARSPWTAGRPTALRETRSNTSLPAGTDRLVPRADRLLFRKKAVFKTENKKGVSFIKTPFFIEVVCAAGLPFRTAKTK